MAQAERAVLASEIIAACRVPPAIMGSERMSSHPVLRAYRRGLFGEVGSRAARSTALAMFDAWERAGESRD